MPRNFGTIQKKVLLLLLGGITLGLTTNPRKYFRVLKTIKKDWDFINSQKMHRTIRSLYFSKLIKVVENKDGSVTIVLSEKGRERAIKYKISEMEIKKSSHWDKKWRIVIFDIPEKIKIKREIVRSLLRRLGFRELQKSVFLIPYDCLDEIEYICEFYEIGKYIRYIIAEHIDNEEYLKKSFNL